MLADQLDDSLDGRVVEHFGVCDLDPESVRQYRQVFAARSPTHPWIASPDLQFLEQIGAWRKDRVAEVEGITFAGLMMFGKDRAICDPAAVPEFHVDYRERLSSDPSVRWTDRIWPDGTWTANLFQFYQRVVPRLTVQGVDGAPIFVKRLTVSPSDDLEEKLMAMLYRHYVEFAVGHGVSVHAEVSPESSERALLVRTEFIPRYEVPRTAPPTEGDADENPAFGKLHGLVLDMKKLAEADIKKIPKMLEPLVTAYRDWIDREEAKLSDPNAGLAQFGDAPRVAIDNCRATLARIEAGLRLVAKDQQVFEAFGFMNRAMWLQRTHSIYSERVRKGEQPDFDKDVDRPENRSWRPFQIAFILLNLPGVTKLDHAERGEGADALADLLFFPTGGGKTEAYLGLSAYTMAHRRLQGTVAGRVGSEGVAVLMRYTLRLLTIQQFQRATALMCACESIRRKALEQGDQRWGTTPVSGRPK